MARASGRELDTLLHFVHELHRVDERQMRLARERCNRVCAMLDGLIRAIRRSVDRSD